MAIDLQPYIDAQPELAGIFKGQPGFWLNPFMKATEREIWENERLGLADIKAADADLRRYAPLIAALFPETKPTNGIIESALEPIPQMRARLASQHELHGDLFLKMDSDLPVCGSIKARGGMYEVLKHAEELALEHGLLASKDDDYTKLAIPEAKRFFGQYKVQVGSTGNLGLSIGITAAALGFQAIVHMSSDAKEWKQTLLRQRGATVREYDTDFNTAIKTGRKESAADPYSYFVDDVRSQTLFLGYATAALRLRDQLAAQHVLVDEDHPLFVYSPAGVGGSAGGVAFGCKAVFGAAAHVFFVEPAPCPSIILGMLTGKNNDVSVMDIGLNGKTEADGLACPSPSALTPDILKPLLSGIFTVADGTLFDYLRDLHDSEGMTIEPSSCATFEGPAKLFESPQGQRYLAAHGLADKVDNIHHIGWATGGCMVPAEINEQNLQTHIDY